MRQSALFALGAILLTATAVRAQTMVGVVLEDSARMPIMGASVELLTPKERLRMAVLTDSIGGFRLTSQNPGTFLLQIRHPSYTTLLSDTISLRREEVVAVEVRLAPAAIALEPLIVQSRIKDRLLPYRERLTRSAFGRFITRAQIDARPGATATDLLYEIPRIEIIRIGNGWTGPPVKFVTMPGPFGRCGPGIFIDGMRIQQYPESGLDALLSASMLEGIEVYVGLAGVPPEFQTSMNSCGVVAFWTRPFERGRKVNLKKLGWIAGVAAAAFMATGLMVTN